MIFKNNLSSWFTKRYQFVIREEASLAEKRTFRYNRTQLISLGIVLCSLLVACGSVLTTTILSRWLNPTHLAQVNQHKLIQLASEVDVLEQQIMQQKKFIALLQSVIAGKDPSVDAPPSSQESATKQHMHHRQNKQSHMGKG